MMEADHSRANADGEAGFTLVELLVALALLGLMIALMLTAFHGGRQTLQAVERKQAEPSVEAAQALLRELLSGARPPKALPGSEAPPAFIGKPEEMIFTTLLEKRGQYGGLYRVRIVSVPRSNGRSGQTLVVEMSVHRPPTQGGAEIGQIVARHVLLEGADGLRLSYFGLRQGEEVSRWSDTWREAQDLPTLVSIELGAGLSDARRGLTLAVRLSLAWVM